MSSLEQSRPLKVQTEQLDVVVPMHSNEDVPTRQPRSDSQLASEKNPLQVLVDAEDEQCLIREATILNTKEIKSKGVIVEPPAIPKRSTLRASQFLDSLRLNSIKSATKSLAAAHTVYMSSEEDASSSSGEFSDNDYEASDEESEKSPVRSSAQEITARVVSVVFVGKPSVVDLTTCRRPTSPPKRPQSELIRLAASSRLGTDLMRSRAEPQRNSTLAPVTSHPKASLSPSPSFLSQDPFSNGPYTKRQSSLTFEPTSSPKPYLSTPNTPTRALQRIQKTINLARKRSRPNLKVSPSSSASTSSLNLPSLNMSEESQDSNKGDTYSTMTYNDMLKTTRRKSASMSRITQSSTSLERPSSPNPPAPIKRGLLSGFNMNRRRSMKIWD
ncbi:hypothetical protein GGS21DRAFT_497735 [Xylaria nigripes]|nr:hypothetical protein GGS21DRAFT_497735 [Xylaria nigripes]